MSLLDISNVTLSFGGVNALSEVNMKIEPGLITSIIGPNGSGKTSLLNCASGFYRPSKGDILFGEPKSSIARLSPRQISNLGIARAFQNLELFSGLSTLDNLLLARHRNLRYNFLQAILHFGKASRMEAENREYVEEVIDFMELQPYRNKIAGSFPYGIQKRPAR